MSEDESRASTAYRVLEEHIVTLRLKPGEAITESKLATQLDMGRTPIREAVQRLSWEGLVDIRPRLGIVISEMNPADFARVLAARHPLEKLLAGASARLASKDERLALHKCASDLKSAAACQDVPEFMRLDKKFDEIVAVAACNPFAAKAIGPLQTHSRRFWFRYLGETDLNPAAWSHLDLMTAIEAGDEAAAIERADDLMHYLRRQAAALTETA